MIDITIPAPETLGISLVAAHMTGDYLLQSARMAAHKLTDPFARLRHVIVYTSVVAVVLSLYAHEWSLWAVAVSFVFVTHYMTDSKRWRTSNPWPAMPILQDQSLHAVQLAIAAIIATA